MEIDKDTGSEQHAKKGQEEEEEDVDKEVIISITANDGFTTKCSLTKLQRIPYFASKTSDRWWTADEGDNGTAASVILDEESSFANRNSLHALICYAESKLEQPSLILTKLPRDSDLSNVMKLADYFCLDLPIATNLDELIDLEIRMREVKEVKRQNSKKNKRRNKEIGNEEQSSCTTFMRRRMARDAAATLAFTMMARKLDTKKKRIRQKLFSDVFFIISHARTFGPRLRTHVWRSFETLAELSDKQKIQVEKWVNEKALSYEFYNSKANHHNKVSTTKKHNENLDTTTKEDHVVVQSDTDDDGSTIMDSIMADRGKG